MNRSLTLFPLLPLLSYSSFFMFTSSVLDVCTLVPVFVCGTFSNNLDDVTLLSFVLYSITVQVLRVCILAKIYIFIRNAVVSGPLDNVPTLAMGNFYRSHQYITVGFSRTEQRAFRALVLIRIAATEKEALLHIAHQNISENEYMMALHSIRLFLWDGTQ